MTNQANPDLIVFEVEIAGVSLKLKSMHDEQTVQNLVSIVAQKINQALPKVKNHSLQTAAILACLNFAEELMNFRKQAIVELERLENKADRVISSLEASRIPKAETTL